MDMRGIVVGGFLPAVLYGTAGILQKAAQRAGAGLGPYLLCVGAGVITVGAVATWCHPDRGLPARAAGFAVAMGVAWGAGTWLVALALSRYAVPIAKLAPLYNLNTVIVVLFGLVLFLENRDVAVGRLISGTVLVVLGATFVARA